MSVYCRHNKACIHLPSIPTWQVTQCQDVSLHVARCNMWPSRSLGISPLWLNTHLGFFAIHNWVVKLRPLVFRYISQAVPSSRNCQSCRIKGVTFIDYSDQINLLPLIGRWCWVFIHLILRGKSRLNHSSGAGFIVAWWRSCHLSGLALMFSCR